jgi:ATP-binding cassette subfamily F protein 3
VSILLQAADVSYAHGGNQIFSDISFELKEGDRAALIGENGSGKSTLFRLLAKVMPPDAGAVTHRRGVTIGYLTQEPDLDSNARVGDILAAAAGDPDAMERELDALGRRLADPLDDAEMTAVLDAQAALLAKLDEHLAGDSHNQVADTLAALGLDEQIQAQTFGVLSGGEKKLVALARFRWSGRTSSCSTSRQPSRRRRQGLAGALPGGLPRGGRGHLARPLLDRQGRQRDLRARGQRDLHLPRQLQPLPAAQARPAPADLRAARSPGAGAQEAQGERRGADPVGRQNPKFATRAENQRRKLAAERERLDATPIPILDRKRIKVEFDAERGSTIVVHADNAAKRYGDRVILRPFDLVVRHGERVGSSDRTGPARRPCSAWRSARRSRTRARSGSGPRSRPATTARSTRPSRPTRRRSTWSPDQAADRAAGAVVPDGFKFDRDDTMNRVSALSGGERSRLQVACLILQGANLLLLDEPTNNLDIPSVEELEEALLDFDGTIVAISHDRYFLEKVCGRILELDDGVVTDYPGNWDYYTANRDKGTTLTRGLNASAAMAKQPKARVKV